jgi:hypothetical protein
MFLSFAMFEVLDDDGHMESFLLFPTDAPTVPVDRIRDLRGIPGSHEVELGPLRFYVDDGGLRIHRIAANYGPPAFSRNGDYLEVHIQHRALPVADHTTGYYSLLLPSGYFGPLQASSDVRHLEDAVTWLEDTRRMLVSVELYNQDGPVKSLSLEARLKKDADPRPGFKQPGFARHHSKDIYRDWRGPHHSGVCNFIRAANASQSPTVPSLFLCHSSSDKAFVRKLAIGLSGSGFKVWIDEAEIRVGDSLIQKIESGILEATYLVAVLSKASVQSRWCQEELRMALVGQIGSGKIRVLPVVVDECEIPGFLREKKYADFKNPKNFDQSLRELCDAIV